MRWMAAAPPPVLAALLLFAAPASSQETAVVSGVVSDASTGAPLAGAVLTLRTTRSQTITDEEGGFALEAPVGAHVLRVQRYGYEDLDRPLVVAGGMAPLDLRLQPAPIELDALEVTGNARADLAGIVLDAQSGEPVPFAEVTLAGASAVELGRPVPTDPGGAFTLPDVLAGGYLLRIERIGYHSLYVPVFHGVPPDGVEVRMEADSLMLRGLARVSEEMEVRRRESARPAMVFDERTLRGAPDAGMRVFLERHARNRVVSCGRPQVRGCIYLRGSATRPVVVIDGFRVPEPPTPSNSFYESAAPPPIGLEQLDYFSPHEFYSVEYFVCGGYGAAPPDLSSFGGIAMPGYVEIHAYTYDYMERLAREPRLPASSCRR